MLNDDSRMSTEGQSTIDEVGARIDDHALQTEFPLYLRIKVVDLGCHMPCLAFILTVVSCNQCLESLTTCVIKSYHRI